MTHTKTMSLKFLVTYLFAILIPTHVQASTERWEPDCKRVARNAVIGILLAERPTLKVDDFCDGGGLCLNEANMITNSNEGVILYRVSGEYFSGNFAYDIAFRASAEACMIKSVKLVYAD